MNIVTVVTYKIVLSIEHIKDCSQQTLQICNNMYSFLWQYTF